MKLIFKSSGRVVKLAQKLPVIEGVKKGNLVTVCGFIKPCEDKPEGRVKVGCMGGVDTKAQTTRLQSWIELKPGVVGCEYVDQ